MFEKITRQIFGCQFKKKFFFNFLSFLLLFIIKIMRFRLTLDQSKYMSRLSTLAKSGERIDRSLIFRNYQWKKKKIRIQQLFKLNNSLTPSPPPQKKWMTKNVIERDAALA